MKKTWLLRHEMNTRAPLSFLHAGLLVRRQIYISINRKFFGKPQPVRCMSMKESCAKYEEEIKRGKNEM